MYTQQLFRLLLLIGAGFYLFEFILHVAGLPILEHDKIFLPTHDRYIALYGLTYAALLALTATNVGKYKTLYVITSVGILLGMLNALYISRTGGYAQFFGPVNIDSQLPLLGYVFGAWYIVTLSLGYRVYLKH